MVTVKVMVTIVTKVTMVLVTILTKVTMAKISTVVAIDQY